MNDETDPADLLLPHQAARLLGVHISTLNRYARDGHVRFRTLPSGHRRYTKEDLAAVRENPPQETP